MKWLINSIITILVSFFSMWLPAHASEHPTLAIGSAAPDFKLPGVDGKTYTLASFSKADVLVIIFTCDHCPTAQAYEERVKQISADYKSKNVAVVAISPNDPAAITLDELGYTDLSDSFEEMKLRARQKQYNFPYLYDGKTQSAAHAYGPVATPHAFVFDKQRRLRFQGRIDDMENPRKTPGVQDTRNAIDALLGGKEVAVTSTKVFGCSVKWAEKESRQEIVKAEWSKEPVTVDTISEAGVKELLQNNTDKLRLVNVWATWCGPCVAEFTDFIAMYHMYRRRDFELVTISADAPANKEKVLKFLRGQQASNTNYLFASDDKYKLIEAIDPNWQGALPYTVLVEPGGRIIYAKGGRIDVAEMKKSIVDNPLIGRYY